MKKMVLVFLTVLLMAGTATAGKYDLEFATDFTDQAFGTVVREAGMATAYRGIAPAEPEGVTGFDAGVEASFIEIDSGDWDNAVADVGDAPDYLAVPRLHVRKGLPFGIDVGASYAKVVDSDLELIGAELQYALLEGTVATPALSLRGSYSTLEGSDDLDLQTYGADAVISKGFLMFTPYAGIGVVRIEGEYDGNDPTLRSALSDHDFNEVRYFGGVQAAMALLRFTLDVEYSRLPVYTAKISLGW